MKNTFIFKFIVSDKNELEINKISNRLRQIEMTDYYIAE